MLDLMSDRGRADPETADERVRWTRRVDELCGDLCRAVHGAATVHELTSTAVELIVRTLRADAAGVWLLDTTACCWRLSAAAGALEREDVRSSLQTLPARVAGKDRVSAGTLGEDISQQWSSIGAGCVTRHGVSRSPVAGAIRGEEGGPLGVLLVWSSAVRDAPLCAAAEAVARELSVGFAALRRGAAVHEQARLGSAIFECAPLAIVCVDAEWRCRRWNPAAEKLFGWPSAEALHQPLGIVPAGERSAWSDYSARCVRDRVPVQGRLPGQRWDATPLNLSVRFVPLLQRSQSEPEVLLLITDETERESIQQYLRIELDVTAILSQSTSIESVRWKLLNTICRRMDWREAEFWEVDADAACWRRAAAWDAAQTAPPPAEDAGRVVQLPLETGLPGAARRQREVIWSADAQRAEQRDGPAATRDAGNEDYAAVPVFVGDEVEAVLVFFGIQPGPVGGRLHDMFASVADQVGQTLAREQMRAALQETEEALRQTRKMEAIGRLAGGVAHDFNNLLTVILGNCELLQDQLAGQSAGLEHLGEIRAASDRAVQLTRQLLTFSRKRESRPEVLNVNQVLCDFERMLRRVVGANVNVEMRLEPDLHAVRLDRVEFEQVMLNLAANARDAMPEGGTLTITTSNAALGLRAVASYPDVKPGDFVELCVADCGCGMDEETQRRVFQPFFTTKEVGKGTGLGLATVYGIVRNAHGFVRVESAPGAGTRFVIDLPRSPIGIVPREVTAPPGVDSRGTETILVVEDEDVLRNLVQRILQVHGYTVHAAPNGPAALQLLDKHRAAVHLLLTDVVMPEMSGLQLAAEARKRRPDLPALFMSGYPDRADPSGHRLPHGPDLLCKPFTSDALVRTVRQALDSAPARGT